MTARDITKIVTPSGVLALAALLALVLALAGFARKSDLQAMESAQRNVNEEILMKLDCALWELPRGCRDTMSPRSIR